MQVTDEMVQAARNAEHLGTRLGYLLDCSDEFAKHLIRAALEAALSQPVAEAVDIELQCPSCKSVEPYRLQIGGDAPAGVTFRTFPAPAVAQPGETRWYFADGPEGHFYAATSEFANRLIERAGYDRDEWTVTDLQNPRGAGEGA